MHKYHRLGSKNTSFDSLWCTNYSIAAKLSRNEVSGRTGLSRGLWFVVVFHEEAAIFQEHRSFGKRQLRGLHGFFGGVGFVQWFHRGLLDFLTGFIHCFFFFLVLLMLL